MTRLERIMNLLRDRELTSLEIASKLEFPKGNCSSYLNTLYKDGRIERISDKRPFKYRMAMSSDELLTEIYNFMGNCMVIRKDKQEEAKQKRGLIVKIKERITKCQTY